MDQHPSVNPVLAAPARPGATRLPTAAEQTLMAEIMWLEAQAILNERVCAALDVDHGRVVRNALTVDEMAAFTTLWSEQVLDLCLRAGTTSVEVRRALRTGELPDHGLVSSLAAFRAPFLGPTPPVS